MPPRDPQVLRAASVSGQILQSLYQWHVGDKEHIQTSQASSRPWETKSSPDKATDRNQRSTSGVAHNFTGEKCVCVRIYTFKPIKIHATSKQQFTYTTHGTSHGSLKILDDSLARVELKIAHAILISVPDVEAEICTLLVQSHSTHPPTHPSVRLFAMNILQRAARHRSCAHGDLNSLSLNNTNCSQRCKIGIIGDKGHGVRQTTCVFYASDTVLCF